MIDGFLVSFIALDGRLSAQLLYTDELLGEKMRRYSRTDCESFSDCRAAELGISVIILVMLECTSINNE